MEMSVFMQKLQIKQKACYIEQNGSGGPIILWGMYPHRGNEIAHMWDCLMEIRPAELYLRKAQLLEALPEGYGRKLIGLLEQAGEERKDFVFRQSKG